MPEAQAGINSLAWHSEADLHLGLPALTAGIFQSPSAMTRLMWRIVLWHSDHWCGDH